jgi:transglutaminase-like putative cysteine protease
MRLDIRYVTRFAYARPVRESGNELRACPTTDERQQLLSYRVVTAPSARVLSTTDYWGTRVDAFGVRTPHTALEIIAEAVVDTGPVPLMTSSPGMAELDDPAFRDAHAEYLGRSPHTAWGEGIAAEARRRAADAGDGVLDVVLSMATEVGRSLTYAPGSTYVGVDVEDVLAAREGVCQDFAHLVVALCRSIGIPARYVSGYLFTTDDATGEDTTEDLVNVATHAWIEAAIPGAGWFPFDPTNQTELGERHVKIGHGRDYDDVPPLKGVFSGPAEHQLDVAVQMRRMSASDPGAAERRARAMMAAQQQQQ